MTDIFLPNIEYTKNANNWRLVRDLIKGESALKQHDLSLAANQAVSQNSISISNKVNYRYLPIPNEKDCSQDNNDRYCKYVNRASLFNATKRTEQGLAGMVFSKPSSVDLPDPIEYLETDADGSGSGIDQQASEVLNDVLETGREGLLVDYPQTDRPTTRAEAETNGKRASIHVYKCESILDWASTRINNKSVLTFVKLKEKETSRSHDGLTCETTDVIRVLILVDGEYRQRVYKNSKSTAEYDEYTPKNANGRPFNYIPFFFIGSVNNRPNVDPAPLIELAEVNLAHYRNSADFEESAFVTGQPTIAIAGLTDMWISTHFADGIPFGSRGGLPLPQGASAQILQAAPNTMPEQGMDRKEKQMVELGARLITSGGGAETAEAARIKHSADASVLSVIVRNINQAYRDAIRACMDFMLKTPAEYKFSLNSDFFASKLTGADLLALVQSWQQGAISKNVLDQNLKAGGVIAADVDLEEMNDEIDNQPSGLAFE